MLYKFIHLAIFFSPCCFTHLAVVWVPWSAKNRFWNSKFWKWVVENQEKKFRFECNINLLKRIYVDENELGKNSLLKNGAQTRPCYFNYDSRRCSYNGFVSIAEPIVRVLISHFDNAAFQMKLIKSICHGFLNIYMYFTRIGCGLVLFGMEISRHRDGSAPPRTHPTKLHPRPARMEISPHRDGSAPPRTHPTTLHPRPAPLSPSLNFFLF